MVACLVLYGTPFSGSLHYSIVNKNIVVYSVIVIMQLHEFTRVMVPNWFANYFEWQRNTLLQLFLLMRLMLLVQKGKFYIYILVHVCSLYYRTKTSGCFGTTEPRNAAIVLYRSFCIEVYI